MENLSKNTRLIFTLFLVLIHSTLQARIEQKLTDVDGMADDFFGRSVALSGNRALVGKINDDDQAEDAGAVFVYEMVEGQWQESAKLFADDAAAFDKFGLSVSFDTANSNFIAIGSPGDDDVLDDSGAVYIFEFNGATWQQLNKIIPTEATIDQGFGSSISFSEQSVLIGAPVATINGNFAAGVAYLFEPDVNNQWQQTKKFNANSPGTFDYFASDVILSDDIALISVPLDDGQVANTGSIYFFKKINDIWTYQQTIVDDTQGNNDKMGYSISLFDNQLITGVVEKNVFTSQGIFTNAGLANIFEYDGNQWSETAELISSDLATGSNIGEQVSLFNNYALVSRQRDDSNKGAVYLFKYINDNWIEIDKIKASDAISNANLGSDVVLNGYTFMIAAQKDSKIAENSGAVYMYDYELIFKHGFE
jgi:hypothetical protein